MKDNLPPVHPGEYIADGIAEIRINQAQLAEVLGCSRQLITNIIKGRKGLSMEICALLPVALGSTMEFWSGLQHRYDLKVAAGDTSLQKTVAQAQDRMSKLDEKKAGKKRA